MLRLYFRKLALLLCPAVGLLINPLQAVEHPVKLALTNGQSLNGKLTEVGDTTFVILTSYGVANYALDILTSKSRIEVLELGKIIAKETLPAPANAQLPTPVAKVAEPPHQPATTPSSALKLKRKNGDTVAIKMVHTKTNVKAVVTTTSGNQIVIDKVDLDNSSQIKLFGSADTKSTKDKLVMYPRAVAVKLPLPPPAPAAVDAANNLLLPDGTQKTSRTNELTPPSLANLGYQPDPVPTQDSQVAVIGSVPPSPTTPPDPDDNTLTILEEKSGEKIAIQRAVYTGNDVLLVIDSQGNQVKYNPSDFTTDSLIQIGYPAGTAKLLTLPSSTPTPAAAPTVITESKPALTPATQPPDAPVSVATTLPTAPANTSAELAPAPPPTATPAQGDIEIIPSPLEPVLPPSITAPPSTLVNSTPPTPAAPAPVPTTSPTAASTPPPQKNPDTTSSAPPTTHNLGVGRITTITNQVYENCKFVSKDKFSVTLQTDGNLVTLPFNKLSSDSLVILGLPPAVPITDPPPTSPPNATATGTQTANAPPTPVVDNNQVAKTYTLTPEQWRIVKSQIPASCYDAPDTSDGSVHVTIVAQPTIQAAVLTTIYGSE
jgi:hypothetical protein